MKTFIWLSVLLGFAGGISLMVWLLNKPNTDWSAKEAEFYKTFFDMTGDEKISQCVSKEVVKIAEHFKCPIQEGKTAEESYFACADKNSKMEDATTIALAICVGEIKK